MISNDKPQQQLAVKGASHYWQQWLQLAHDYLDRQQWQLAACWFGSCMEAAEAQLAKAFLEATRDPVPISAVKPSAADRYMIAGHSLCEALRRNGQPQLQLHFLLTIHLRLLQLANSKYHPQGLLQDNLEISLAMLSRYQRQQGHFKGYHDCYLETRLCIEQCSRSLQTNGSLTL
jgi:hypothetical protein